MNIKCQKHRCIVIYFANLLQILFVINLDPTFRAYGGSSSINFRVSAAAAQKNEGYNWIEMVRHQ